MRAFVVTLVLVFAGVAACSSKSCPAVPLHCICGVDPVCVDGAWVCNCPDAAPADASTE